MSGCAIEYNLEVVEITLEQALARPEGPERTAALAAWFQGLFREGEAVPVLVGGAAVELYTGGAYTTGDLDFVGVLNTRVEEELEAAGFQRRGRHWIHEEEQVFLELPGRALEEGEEPVIFCSGSSEVRILSPEDVLVDRLAAWWFWRSSTDGVAACKLFWRRRGELDSQRLENRARAREVAGALERLLDFVAGRAETPDEGEVSQWAEESPE